MIYINILQPRSIAQSCTKWNDTNNEIMPRFKLSSLTFRRTLYSSHATWKKFGDETEQSCPALLLAKNQMAGPSGLWLKKTHESICKLYSLIDHRLRWESTSTVHVVLFALKKVILLTSLQSGANKCRYQALPGAGVSHRCERADQSSWSLHRNENIWPEWKPAAVTPPPPRFSINAWQRGHL